MGKINLKEYLLKQEAEYVERVGPGLNADLQQKLHDDIASGKIDIGPVADHSKPVKDKRPGINQDDWYLIQNTLEKLAMPSEIDRNGDLNY